MARGNTPGLKGIAKAGSRPAGSSKVLKAGATPDSASHGGPPIQDTRLEKQTGAGGGTSTVNSQPAK